MISVEDVDGNLLPTLQKITPFKGKRLLDIGSGSGRIPLLTHDLTYQSFCLDLHWAMLAENSKQREKAGGSWPLLQSDMRSLPFKDNFFDIVTAGWAIGHFQDWYSENWKEQVTLVINEMMRVAHEQGTLIIIETMTTGSLTPAPPHEGLAQYYSFLESQWGFYPQIISTDFLFPDLETACYYTDFFFGEELAQKVLQNKWVRLPEWTSIWSKKID
jgi:ubiquinone/menaquinone biosynthesis C-methylase UbiE